MSSLAVLDTEPSGLTVVVQSALSGPKSKVWSSFGPVTLTLPLSALAAQLTNQASAGSITIV